MRKALAATLLAGGLSVVPALEAVHAQSDTTTEANDDDDDGGDWGLLGLLGLLGLAGLAGLKRRDVRSVSTSDYYDRTSDTTTIRP